MIKNLQSLYQNSKYYTSKPKVLQEDYYWFEDSKSNEWIGIPKNSLHLNELQILKSLFMFHDFSKGDSLRTSVEKWQQFLFHSGEMPADSMNLVRLIQFECNEQISDFTEFQGALSGFFSEQTEFLWLNNNKGIIIEEKKSIEIVEDDFLSISNTFENDLYIKIYFYIGKFRIVNKDLKEIFEYEQALFNLGLQSLSKERVFTFEKLFPYFLIEKLPEELKRGLTQEVQVIFQENPELLSTIKVYLENNLNVSMTAKKLYIHRNTLQYRLDRFIEKSGINLKDFNGALTVYLACLQEERTTKSR